MWVLRECLQHIGNDDAIGNPVEVSALGSGVKERGNTRETGTMLMTIKIPHYYW